MNGPEHYKAAEDDIERAAMCDYGNDQERYYMARAQVHATLALAAATALSVEGAWHAAEVVAAHRGGTS